MWVRDACAERWATSWAVQSQTQIHTQAFRELPTLNSLKRLELNPLNRFIFRLLRLMGHLRYRRSPAVTNNLETLCENREILQKMYIKVKIYSI